MGNFFTNYHISLKDASKKDSIAIIEDFMKKSGYERSNSEDESEVSFILYESNDWMSFVPIDEENSNSSICDELFDYALSLDGVGLSVECVDSDFATLRLRMNKNKVDTGLVIGCPYSEELKESNNTKEWEDVIADTGSLDRIASENYTFIEEGLEEIGKLLGMSEEQILISQDNNEALKCTRIGFNQSGKKNNKSFRTVFKEIFSEGLKDDGFVAVKGRQPYFVRAANDEVIHIITFNHDWCAEAYEDETYGWKCIEILVTVSSVYRERIIDFSVCPNEMTNVLFPLRWVNHYNCLFGLPRIELETLLYNPNDLESMKRCVLTALDMVKKIVIPMLSNIDGIEMCTKYMELLTNGSQSPPMLDIESDKIDDSEQSEGLTYVLMGENYDVEEIYKWREIIKTQGASTENEKIRIKTEMQGKCQRKKERINSKLSNQHYLEIAKKELLERKTNNIDYLRKCGINI